MPKATEESLIGAVYKSWSVFCLFSSLKSRMVRMGIIAITIMNRVENISESSEIPEAKITSNKSPEKK